MSGWFPKIAAAYNKAVNSPQHTERGPKPRSRAIHATEASGLLLIAALLLVLTIIRYWHAIHWSLRWQ